MTGQFQPEKKFKKWIALTALLSDNGIYIGWFGQMISFVFIWSTPGTNDIYLSLSGQLLEQMILFVFIWSTLEYAGDFHCPLLAASGDRSVSKASDEALIEWINGH